MTCYYCEMEAMRDGGFRYGVQPAAGVCRRCHIGVCLAHATRYPEHGFTCLACAKELGLARPVAKAKSTPEKGTGILQKLIHH